MRIRQLADRYSKPVIAQALWPPVAPYDTPAAAGVVAQSFAAQKLCGFSRFFPLSRVL